MDAYSDGLASGLAIGQNNNCNNGYGWGNGMWGDWFAIIILFALLGGWGGNGCWGFGGNGNQQLGYDIGKLATTNDVAVGFAQNATLNNLNDLKLGQAGIQQTLCQGFSGINSTVNTNGYETRLAINNLGYQLQDCCCRTNNNITSGFADVNYNMAKNTCDITNAINNSTRDIIDSQRDGTNAILNFLTQEKISSLQAENQTLKFQASQTAQNAYLTATMDANQAELIRRLGRDCPVPSYLVPNPNCCYGNGYGYNGCGCGCGCGV